MTSLIECVCSLQLTMYVFPSFPSHLSYPQLYCPPLTQTFITPYSSFQVKVPGDKEGEIDEFIFESVVDDMPPPPQVVKIHPYGCDITQFKAELSANNDKKLKDFLANQFMGVTKEIAEDFFQLLEIDPNKHPNELTSKEIIRRNSFKK